MNEIIAVIWVVVMIIGAVKTVIKKKKQQEQASPAASKPAYAAQEEDIRSFLEEIGAKSEPAVTQMPQPAQPPAAQRKRQYERSSWDERQDVLVEDKVQRKQARSSRPAPPAKKTPKLPPVRSVWDEVDDAARVSVLSAEHDPVAALAGRLSPVQRAVIWREILDTPPGLRARGDSSVLGWGSGT